jgi:hypothetical protein
MALDPFHGTWCTTQYQTLNGEVAIEDMSINAVDEGCMHSYREDSLHPQRFLKRLHMDCRGFKNPDDHYAFSQIK